MPVILAEQDVGRVVRLMEPDMDIVPCFNEASGCVIDPACLLKGALAEARDAFLAALDRDRRASDPRSLGQRRAAQPLDRLRLWHQNSCRYSDSGAFAP